MRRPRKDAALVRVEATSVNPIDGKFLWSSGNDIAEEVDFARLGVSP
jgi:NADPH:quinone reductase-like Zn-dependent oxidoreductase